MKFWKYFGYYQEFSDLLIKQISTYKTGAESVGAARGLVVPTNIGLHSVIH